LESKRSHQQFSNGCSEKLIDIDAFEFIGQVFFELYCILAVNGFQEVLGNFLFVLSHVFHLFYKLLDDLWLNFTNFINWAILLSIITNN